ncbi:HET-domain-containing protein, partial [Ophiobolus disseminans]
MGTSAPLPQLDTIDSPSDFQHNPLNRQAPSIRLVRIRAASSLDATIHCDIRHASTTSIYICLSYVWGEIDRGHWIFLNGRRFWIRENLWHFLRSARQKFHIRSEWLWIDALCIDQTNNDERTHQVQQMGRIFSSAVKVISWLGMSDEIAEYFEDRSNLDLVHFKESCHAYWNPRSLDPKLRCFYACEYWSRAWITQEFALARRNTFMARDVEVDCEQLEKTYARDWTMVERVNFEMSFGLRGRSLIYLLDRYHYKKSQIPRDRVFSLLALCGEGSDLKADYGLPHVDLARDILQSCKESM